MQNPKSSFEFVKIEDILKEQSDNHSSFKYHILKFYAILFITSGNGKHFIDFDTYNSSKGTILLIGNGQTHKFSENTDLKGYVLLFQNDFLWSLLTINETLNIFQIFNNSLFEPKIQLKKNQFLDVISRIGNVKKEYFHVKDNFTSKILDGEVYTILSILFRDSKAIKNILYSLSFCR